MLLDWLVFLVQEHFVPMIKHLWKILRILSCFLGPGGVFIPGQNTHRYSNIWVVVGNLLREKEIAVK